MNENSAPWFVENSLIDYRTGKIPRNELNKLKFFSRLILDDINFFCRYIECVVDSRLSKEKFG